MRRIEQVMGTVFVVDTPERTPESVVDELFQWFDWVERTFSVFLPDSDVSRIGRGALSIDDCDPQVRGVLTRCEELRALTSGAFDHDPPGGQLDPSAFVKGWSVDRAGLILRLAGVHRWRINAGGDVLAGSGKSQPTATRVGIRHPGDAGEIAAVLAIENGAVATSGEYERGAHIWNRSNNSELRSLTVVGPELGTADALATALFAIGQQAPDWLASFPGYAALALTDDRCTWTPDLDDSMVAPTFSPQELSRTA